MQAVVGAAGEARAKLVRLIYESYMSGLSVLEITRIMGARTSDYSYTVLRKAGAISPLKRGKPPSIDLPAGLSSVFEQKKFSFVKWCNFWKFSLDEALDALRKSDLVGESDRVLEIHRAFKRDFPDHYTKLYPDSPFAYLSVVRLKQGLVRDATKLDLGVCWDSDRHCFVAKIVDEGIEGYGDSWAKAVGDLEQVWWITKSVKRLTDAIDDLLAAVPD
ncbi:MULTISPECIES: hypothetical protein [Geobacter]|uniref:Uncharacterized protein n=1 Tax=Geobacter benzoatilyticus TaxID=2815309 RepID=A0ABX7Q618_9BACT|nr:MULTISPECIES: hypothetical protein [Geobacter]QSV46886.1 hypothetical protein JZM60_06375 [Geobacter benzoatilyticus]